MNDDLEDKISLVPTAIPWYATEEDYLAVVFMLGLPEDDTPFPYDVWITRLEAHEELIQSKGAITRRIPVDPVALKAWCDANDREVSRPAITEFIMWAHGGRL